MNSYLHALPSQSVMHAHAETQGRSTQGCTALKASDSHPDSTLLSTLASTGACTTAAVVDNMGNDNSFPLSWPPSDSSAAHGSGQITAAAQIRDLHAWYRSCMIAAPFVPEVPEPLHGPTMTRSRRSGVHPVPLTHLQSSPQHPQEMLLRISMDASVCQQLLADISALDTSQAARAHVTCLKELKVQHFMLLYSLT